MERADPEVAEAGLQTLEEELPPGVGERPRAEQRAVGGVHDTRHVDERSRFAAREHHPAGERPPGIEKARRRVEERRPDRVIGLQGDRADRAVGHARVGLEARDAVREMPLGVFHRFGAGEPGGIHRTVGEPEAVPHLVHHGPGQMVRRLRTRGRVVVGPPIEISRTEVNVAAGHPSPDVLHIGGGEGPARDALRRRKPDGVDRVARPALVVGDRFFIQDQFQVGRPDFGPGAEAAFHALAPERGVETLEVRQVAVFEEPEPQRKRRSVPADRPGDRRNPTEPAVASEEPVAICRRRLPPRSKECGGNSGPARTHASDNTASPPHPGWGASAPRSTPRSAQREKRTLTASGRCPGRRKTSRSERSREPSPASAVSLPRRSAGSVRSRRPHSGDPFRNPISPALARGPARARTGFRTGREYGAECRARANEGSGRRSDSE